MPLIPRRREVERHRRQESTPQPRRDVPFVEQPQPAQSSPVNSSILATVILVGLSLIAAELLVIATPSMGYAASFIVLVLGALLAACILATAMARILGKDE